MTVDGDDVLFRRVAIYVGNDEVIEFTTNQLRRITLTQFSAGTESLSRILYMSPWQTLKPEEIVGKANATLNDPEMVGSYWRHFEQQRAFCYILHLRETPFLPTYHGWESDNRYRGQSNGMYAFEWFCHECLWKGSPCSRQRHGGDTSGDVFRQTGANLGPKVRNLNKHADCVVCTCKHAHTHTRTHAHVHTCTHAHVHTRTHAHAHTCTRTHAHTHTRTRAHTYLHPPEVFP